ncbi:unnamed protein product [Diplocarpon coronariae]|uniref:Myb transcription factor n=1 Tax=Diplocarpon coronariae TaxID=2795749 RepID=A0A218YST4_9HELO|nr:hypothetical protein B2J93_4495 [Marssonina coronariae]
MAIDADGVMANTATYCLDGSAHVSKGLAPENQRNDAKNLKKLRRAAKKQRRKNAPDSSLLGSPAMSSAINSSVIDGDVDAPGTMAEEELAQEENTAQEIHLNSDLGEYEQGQEEEPKPPKVVTKDKSKKECRKVRASKKQSKVAALESGDHTQAVEPTGYEQESQDLVSAMRKKQLTNEAQEKESKKKSLADETTSTVQESKDGASSALGQLQESSKLPVKIKKVKKKAQKNPQKRSQDEAAFQNADDSAGLLHLTSTPATCVHSRSQVAAHDDVAELDAQVRSNVKVASQPGAEEDHQQEPEQPSEKTLGKRKASVTVMKSKSKRRRSKDSAMKRAELASHGFVSSQVATPANTVISQTPLSHSQPVIHDPVTLGETAAKLYASQMENERNLPALSDTSSPGPPPSRDFLASSQQKRATPDYIPAYLRKAPAALVDPTESDPYELPPSSQPEPQPEPETQPESEPGVKPAEQSGDEPEALRLLSAAPKSSESRKRRLPTGEPESSQVQPTLKNLKPKDRSSKTMELEKIKTPSSSEADPATKGARIADNDARVIIDAVELYRDMNDLDQRDVNKIIQEDATIDKNRNFWKFICERVPKVPRVKVMNQCRRKFHNFEARGVWTDEQDKDLKDAYERNPGKWKVIGAQLNRFSQDCRDRWRNYLVCGDNQKKDVWDKEEEERLKMIVNECMLLTGTKSANIDWQNVSSRMDHTRSRLQCITKWKSIQEREAITDEDLSALQPIAKQSWRLEEAEYVAHVMTPGEKLDLLYSIRSTNAGSEGKIPWVRVQQDIGVRAPRMALRVALRNFQEYIDDRERMSLQDIVSALIEIYEEAAPDEPHIFGFVRPARYNKHDMRESIFVEDDDNVDGEPRTIKEGTQPFKVRHDERDSAGPSTHKSRKRKGRKAAMMAAMEMENDQTPAPKKAPKKLRSRMKGQNEVESQETNSDTANIGDEIIKSFETAKSNQVKGRTPARKAKKPITKARTSKHLSEYRVNASEDEDDEQMVLEESIPQKSRVLSSEYQAGRNEKDRHVSNGFQNNDRRHYPDLPQSDEGEVLESDIEMANEHHSAPSGHIQHQDVDGIEDEAEDYSYPTHDQESVDLDKPQSATANRSHNGNFSDYDGEDESGNLPLGREESVDLDTPHNAQPHPTTYYSNDDDEGVGVGANGYDSRFVRMATVSSSASSIPHTPKVLLKNRGS